jgi:hypothetical protein
MRIKAKKQNEDGIVRLETSGELKEIIVKEDFLNSNNSLIELCFKGKNSSGIVELTPREIDMLNKEFEDKKQLLKGIKVMKFEK